MDIRIDKAATEERRRQLQAMYDRYYQGERCECRYFSECSSGEKKGYHSSCVINVGDGYDLFVNGHPIRIMFMGKENPGDKRQTAVGKTARLTDCLLRNGAVNPHYLKTYMTLCEMLRYFPPDVQPYRRRDDAVLSFFSLTNRFRCATKENGIRTGVDNTVKQREHCLEILREEICIMEPTVLVLQLADTKAHNVFGDDDGLKPVYACGAERIVHSPKHDCYVIETVHPCIRDGSWGTHFVNLCRCIEWLQDEKVLPPSSCDLTEDWNRQTTV